MKELSIEEKAKAYDEAIEKARQLCAYPTTKPFISDLQDLFPELVEESEDEKIRKELLAWLKSRDGQILPIDRYNAAIAWLEKQGKPKEHDVCDNCEQQGNCVSPCCVKLVEKNGEQKPAETEKRAKGNDREIPNLEQNHAENKGMNLNEEDMTPFQKYVFGIIDLGIEQDRGLKQVCDELLALASGEIKKSAWSEEDERIKNNLLSELTNLSVRKLIEKETEKKYASWLESLRPQSQWKPSDEMLEALYRAVPQNVKEISEDEILLDKLYQGLKYGRILSK